MSFTKINQSDLTGKGVVGLPDTPNMSTTDIQEKFDEIALDVIVPKFNELSDELDDAGIDAAVQSEDITNLRLNADNAIEISEDGGSTWHGTASSGHRIMDGSGTIYDQEPKMQFSNNVTIQDDPINKITKVLIQPGDKGDKGDAATITIGDVESGETASVENVGSANDAIFNFVFPKGDDGTAATVAVGTVSSGATASVNNRGTNTAAILDFVLPKGDQGDPGTGLTLLGVYATYADLVAAHPTGTRGNAYYVGDDEEGVVYLWNPDTSAWVNVGELKGPKGDTGNAGTISVGTVSGLAPGSTPTVENVGTTTAAVFNFGLPQGAKGDTGSSGTVAIGTTTTLPSGSDATVTNTGTASAAVLNFGIPTGPQGPQGNPTTVNGKSGNNVTLYGSDIDMSSTDNTKVNAAIGDLTSLTTTAKSSAVAAINELDGDIGNSHKVTSFEVDLQNWTSDTTSQSGTTLYKKQITLTHLYVANPTVEVGAGTGYVLPTTAEQESYDLLQYVTVDDTVPCLYLYASAIPTTAFYISVKGVD